MLHPYYASLQSVYFSDVEHGDPFDRMLVSQAIVNGLTIATPDPAAIDYPVRTMW